MAHFFYWLFGRVAVDDLGDFIEPSSRFVGVEFLAAVITVLTKYI